MNLMPQSNNFKPLTTDISILNTSTFKKKKKKEKKAIYLFTGAKP